MPDDRSDVGVRVRCTVTRWLMAGLLFLAWHFATTFFMPAAAPRSNGSIVWPFGRDSRPLIAGWRGILAPNVLPGDPRPTAAMALAGIASVGFLVALAASFGLFVPPGWWRPVVAIAAVASGALFLLYLGPRALVPLLVDASLLWGVLVRDWSLEGLAAGP